MDGWLMKVRHLALKATQQITITQHLQWPTNRKSYMVYQTSPFSMTLNDT